MLLTDSIHLLVEQQLSGGTNMSDGLQLKAFIVCVVVMYYSLFNHSFLTTADDCVCLTDTSLTISNVLQRHAGMYQCVARSKLGSDYATARLTVLPAGHQSSGGPSPLFKGRPFLKAEE